MFSRFFLYGISCEYITFAEIEAGDVHAFFPLVFYMYTEIGLAWFRKTVSMKLKPVMSMRE